MYSCAIVGPDYERPEVNSLDEWRNDSVASTDSVLNLKWWTMFNDPALDSLIELALENNKDLLIASSRIEEARAYVGFNKADYYPKIGYGGGIFKGNYAGGFLIFPEDQEAGLINGQLSWEIGFWGKVRRATESAKAELLASEYGKRQVQISLITEVASNYFTLLDYWSRYEISKRTYASRDSGHHIIEARFEKGIIPEIDVNQSQIQLAISRAAVPSYERRITSAENRLSILLGQNPDSISFGKTLFEEEVSPHIPAGIPSAILDRRPDILSAEQSLHAQMAKIGVAQAARLPSLNLTSLVGGVSQDLTSFNLSPGWNASLGITGPLFQFGKNKRRVEIEKERTEQALLNYENTVLKAFAEVELALITITTLKEELSAREYQFNAAANAERLSFERYNKGVSSYLEVLENQRSSFEAELLYSQTYQEYLNAHITLYKALGGGWISEEEMNQAQEDKESNQ